MVLPVFFYLLLIFLFSFFSFLFVSLPSFPHPTPPPLFFFFFYWTLFLCPSTIQGIPQAVLPPLPKRPALEKTNGATAVFNTGIFQYQQALANMQLQQHTAFLPPGKCCLFASRGGRRGVPNQHAGQQPRPSRPQPRVGQRQAVPGGGGAGAGRLASLCLSRRLGGRSPL